MDNIVNNEINNRLNMMFLYCTKKYIVIISLIVGHENYE